MVLNRIIFKLLLTTFDAVTIISIVTINQSKEDLWPEPRQVQQKKS